MLKFNSRQTHEKFEIKFCITLLTENWTTTVGKCTARDNTLLNARNFDENITKQYSTTMQIECKIAARRHHRTTKRRQTKIDTGNYGKR